MYESAARGSSKKMVGLDWNESWTINGTLLVEQYKILLCKMFSDIFQPSDQNLIKHGFANPKMIFASLELHHKLFMQLKVKLKNSLLRGFVLVCAKLNLNNSSLTMRQSSIILTHEPSLQIFLQVGWLTFFVNKVWTFSTIHLSRIKFMTK